MLQGKKKKPSNTELIPGLQTVRLLSEGTYSSVLLLKNPQSELYYVLKLVPEYLSIDSNQENHVEFEKRVLTECNPHPFLVRCFPKPGVSMGNALVLEYLSGGNLFQLLQSECRLLTEKELSFFAAEISLALGQLHRHGYVCRDLKFESLLLDAEGHVHLTNYGLSGRLRGLRAVLPSRTETFQRLISIATENGRRKEGNIHSLVFYFAPETLLGKGHTFAGDWWALGILLYCACLGKTPYDYLLNETLFWENPEDCIRNAVLDFQIDKNDFPVCYSEDLRDFVVRLLHPHQEERLGGGEGDVEDVWKHSFLSNFSIQHVLSKELKPPFVPNSHLMKPTSHPVSSIERQNTSEPNILNTSSRLSLPEMFSRLSSSSLVPSNTEAKQEWAAQKRASKELERVLLHPTRKKKLGSLSFHELKKSIKGVFSIHDSNENTSVSRNKSFSLSKGNSTPNAVSLDRKEPIVFDSVSSHDGSTVRRDAKGHVILPPGIGVIPCCKSTS
eukprot:jgi/Galph1/26/GphlegSOOS_G4829.1